MLRSLHAAVLGTWLLLGGLPALAQEPTEASESAEASEDWAYVTVMTGPLERVEASFAELGLPLPGFLRRASIEQNFGFIGPGGLRAEGSLGMRMGPGEPGSTKPSGLMLFPINPDAALLEDFTARGAKLLADSSDTVRIKGMFVRRTPDFLLLGAQTRADITEMDPQVLEERVSAPGVLAEVDANFARWRKTDPSTFYSMLARVEARRAAEGDSSHAQQLGRSVGMKVYERLLDRMRLTLVDARSSLRLRVELEPLAPGEMAPLPKPAFPKGTIGRVDLAYSSTESSQWMKGGLEQFMNALEKDGAFAEAERARLDVDQMRELFTEGFELFGAADAISIAVEPVKGKLLYHQVNQYRSPAGFTERVATLVKKLNAFDKKLGSRRRKAGLGFTTSSAAGVHTSRLTFPGSKVTMDIAESGPTVRIVIASDGKRHLPALLQLPDTGDLLSSGFSGMFDPSAAVDAYLATGEILPFPVRLRTREALRGQLITWSTRAEGTAAVVDIDIPKPLIQAIAQVLATSASQADASEP